MSRRPTSGGDTGIWGTILNDYLASLCVHVGDKGAKGDGVTDDTVAIQNALNAARDQGGSYGGLVFLPVGDYKTTATLNIPDTVSVIGTGVRSNLLPVDCDGFTFGALQTTLGPSVVRDINISGSGTTIKDKAGIRLPGNADAAQVTGVRLENIGIYNFGYGIHTKNLWRSVLDQVRTLNCYFGLFIKGQNAVAKVKNCVFELGGAPIPTGATISKGIYLTSASDYNPGGITEKRPESVLVRDTQCYGFAYGIHHEKGLNVQFDTMDIDATTDTGVKFDETEGGFSIENSYIAVTGVGATYGVRGTTVSSAGADGTPLIAHNRIYMLSGGAATRYGIHIDGRAACRIRDNYLNGWATNDIKVQNTDYVRIRDNHCDSTSTKSIDTATGNTNLVSDSNYTRVP